MCREGELMIEARALGAEYGGRTVFSGLDFSVAQGRILCVTGKNGSGKSTLIKILAGLKDPSEGSLRISGGMDSRSWASSFFSLPPRLTLRETVCGAMKTRSERARAREFCLTLNIERYENHLCSQLSSGTAARAKIALAAARSVCIFLFDEAFAHLDRESALSARSVILSCRERGALVITAHDAGVCGEPDCGRLDLDTHAHSV